MDMSVKRAKQLAVLAIAVAPLFLSGCILEQILDDLVNEYPHAVIEASPREGSAPLDVNFNAQYSRDDGTIIEYRWNFGDPMSTKSAMESASTHTFTDPGTYLVKLTVIDDEGTLRLGWWKANDKLKDRAAAIRWAMLELDLVHEGTRQALDDITSSMNRAAE